MSMVKKMLLVLLCSLFAVNAEAVIAFRAATSAGIRSPTINYRGFGNPASAASGNITPSLSTASGNSFTLTDFIACVVEQHDNVSISFPAGWTQLYSLSTTTTHRASLYYKIAAASETSPLITHAGGNAIIAQCLWFRGVDPGNPFDVAYAAQYAASATAAASGALTTLTANDMLLFVTHVANNPITGVPTGAGGVTWTSRFFNATTSGLRAAEGVYTGTKATAGAVGPITSTLSLASENHGVLLALHRADRLSIVVPTGIVAGDVMIAAVATAPSTVPITAPTGWTLIKAVTQTAPSSNLVSTFYRVASASEPVSYSWGLSTTHTGATGGILSYSGVDNSNPIDVSASQATPSSTSHAAPTVTPTVASDMLVTVHEYASARSWTPPTGMTERVDIASRAASTSGITLEMNELLLGAAVATGAKTAIAASSADAGATVSIALRPAVTAPHHIRIEHDGSASNCAPEPITIKACANAACTAPHFTLSDVTGITLAATGSVTWSPVNTQTITAASGGANNGITLARSSAGAAALSISGTPSPAPSAAYECYNTATNTSGDCNLVYSDNLSFDVPNHTAGTRQAVTMTVCASSFASTTRSVKFWSTYVNPASGTLAGKVVAGSGNADCTSGYAALGTSNAAATSLSLAFGTGTTPQATFSLCYPDVGQVKLDAQYDGGSGNTPPDAGVQKLGNDSFIAKPDHFTVSAIKCTTANAANCGAGALAMAPSGSNPSAADAAGGSFIRAGDTTQAAARFTATVTAKNALNATTPNFGVESAPGPKGIKLTSVLVAPVGGDPGLLTCKTSTTACAVPGGAANFTSGATTITDLAWDDVGIIQLMPKIIDADYLGTGEVTTPTASANIGRFIPDHFEVNPDALNPILTRADLSQTVASATGTTAPATVIDVDDTTGFFVGSKVRIPGAGAGGNAFTATVTAFNAVGLTLTLDTAIGTTLDGGESVVEEWGSYMGEQMNANFVLSAMNAAGKITNNYQGDNAKLNLTAVGNPLGLGAMDTVGPTYNLALNTPQAPTGIFVKGSAAISAPMVVTRGTTPVGTYNAVKIGIAPASAEPDGVKMGAYDLSVAGGANDHTSIMDPLVQAAIQVRYGRLNISNAYGSELLALPVRMIAQYYSGTSWVTSAQDNLSAPSGTLTASAAAGTPLCTGLPTWIAPTNLMSGIGSFTLTPPLNGRCSADITFGLPSYLPNFGGRVTFGIYKSPLIYRRENY